MVRERVVDADALIEDLPAIQVEYAQRAVVFRRHAGRHSRRADIIVDIEVVTLDKIPQRHGRHAALRTADDGTFGDAERAHDLVPQGFIPEIDELGRLAFGQVQKRLEPEEGTDKRPYKNEDDADVSDIDAQTAINALLGHVLRAACPPGLDEPEPPRLEHARRALLGLGKVTVEADLLLVLHSPEAVLLNGFERCRHDLERMGKAVEGAYRKVCCKEKEQQHEPPGVIHVEEAKHFKELGRGLAVLFQVLFRGLILLNHRADDRNDRQDDEQHNRKLHGGKELPDLVSGDFDNAFLVFQYDLPS